MKTLEQRKKLHRWGWSRPGFGNAVCKSRADWDRYRTLKEKILRSELLTDEEFSFVKAVDQQKNNRREIRRYR